MDSQALCAAFAAQAPVCDGWSIRIQGLHGRSFGVRSGTPLPVTSSHDLGAMVVIQAEGGEGYAATADLSLSGLLAAAEQARGWARQARHLIPADPARLPQGQAEWVGPCEQDPRSVSAAEVIERLAQVDGHFAQHERSVDSSATVRWWETDTYIASSHGAQIQQTVLSMVPNCAVTVHHAGQTQVRSLGMHAAAQGGFEVLAARDFDSAGPRLLSQALALLEADECPTGQRDVILLPSQMVLQIHESIGHPLELDRILGDERNYAGTSFVTPDMFGSYRYGSDLLNVSFDPTISGELASYGFDDDGQQAEKHMLIEKGILQRPLGSHFSQTRASLPGTANARASGWNRPTMDRMANLNVEPGQETLQSMIAATERGILLDTNRSWSIDDSRNKFQFGCEYAQLIEDGEITQVVRNPNYRAISATLWRSLVGVGNHDEWQAFGTPNCGKGEPNQLISTGHGAPPCRFADIEVFGGG